MINFRSGSFSFSVSNLLKAEAALIAANIELKKETALQNINSQQIDLLSLMDNKDKIQNQLSAVTTTNPAFLNLAKPLTEHNVLFENSQNSLTTQSKVYDSKTPSVFADNTSLQLIDDASKNLKQGYNINQEHNTSYQTLKPTTMMPPISAQLSDKEANYQSNKNNLLVDATNNNIVKVSQIQGAPISLPYQTNNYLDSLQKQQTLASTVPQHQQLVMANQSQQQPMLMMPPNFTQYLQSHPSSSQFCVGLNSTSSTPVGTTIGTPMSSNPIVSLSSQTFAMAAVLQQQQQNIQNHQLIQQFFASRAQNDYCVICGDRV